MPEFMVCTFGVAMMVVGYRMATTGYDLTRKPPLFYLGWAFIIFGGMVASGAVFYTMWR